MAASTANYCWNRRNSCEEVFELNKNSSRTPPLSVLYTMKSKFMNYIRILWTIYVILMSFLTYNDPDLPHISNRIVHLQ